MQAGVRSRMTADILALTGLGLLADRVCLAAARGEPDGEHRPAAAKLAAMCDKAAARPWPLSRPPDPEWEWLRAAARSAEPLTLSGTAGALRAIADGTATEAQTSAAAAFAEELAVATLVAASPPGCGHNRRGLAPLR